MWLQIGFFDPRDRTREIGPIAELKYLITRDDEQRANAELLALAPTAPHDCDLDCPGAGNKKRLEIFGEMVEVLREIYDHAEKYGAAPFAASKMFARVRAVLAKIKGE